MKLAETKIRYKYLPYRRLSPILIFFSGFLIKSCGSNGNNLTETLSLSAQTATGTPDPFAKLPPIYLVRETTQSLSQSGTPPSTRNNNQLELDPTEIAENSAPRELNLFYIGAILYHNPSDAQQDYSYSISGSDENLFRITDTSHLYLTARPDYEAQQSYTITITASRPTDSSFTPISQDFTITVLDADETLSLSPSFSMRDLGAFSKGMKVVFMRESFTDTNIFNNNQSIEYINFSSIPAGIEIFYQNPDGSGETVISAGQSYLLSDFYFIGINVLSSALSGEDYQISYQVASNSGVLSFGVAELVFDINPDSIYSISRIFDENIPITHKSTYLSESVIWSDANTYYELDPRYGDHSHFTVESDTGLVSLTSPVNFESPLDIDGNNIYSSRIRLSQADSSYYYVDLNFLITDSNDVPFLRADYQDIENMLTYGDSWNIPIARLAAAFTDEDRDKLAEGLISRIIFLPDLSSTPLTSITAAAGFNIAYDSVYTFSAIGSHISITPGAGLAPGSYTIGYRVADNGQDSSLSADHASIVFELTDNNVPVVSPDAPMAYLDEGTNVGDVLVTSLQVVDSDHDVTSQVSASLYYIDSIGSYAAVPESVFKIRNEQGVLNLYASAGSSFDYEQPSDFVYEGNSQKWYSLLVIATDPFSGAYLGDNPSLARLNNFIALNAESTASIDVYLGDIDEHPPVFDNGVSNQLTFFDENSDAVVYSPSASDIEGHRIFYSLAEEHDFAFFTIGPSSGDIRFITAPDYENPLDGDANNGYQLSVIASSGVIGGSYAQEMRAQQNLLITINDIEDSSIEEAIIWPAEQNIVHLENDLQVANLVLARHLQGNPISYSFGASSSADARFFRLESDGRLFFNSTPDYEDPALQRSYTLILTANSYVNGLAVAVQSTLHLTIANIDEAPIFEHDSININYMPSSSSTFVTRSLASDPENDPISYSFFNIADTDANFFTIDSVSGDINFVAIPDPANPQDGKVPSAANYRDNVYELTIIALTDSNATLQNINVTVIDLSSTTPHSISFYQSASGLAHRENNLQTSYSPVLLSSSVQDIRFRIKPVDDYQYFGIEAEQGQLSFLLNPDYEDIFASKGNPVTAGQPLELSLVIEAYSDSSPAIGEQRVIVLLVDVNEVPSVSQNFLSLFVSAPSRGNSLDYKQEIADVFSDPDFDDTQPNQISVYQSRSGTADARHGLYKYKTTADSTTDPWRDFTNDQLYDWSDIAQIDYISDNYFYGNTYLNFYLTDKADLSTDVVRLNTRFDRLPIFTLPRETSLTLSSINSTVLIYAIDPEQAVGAVSGYRLENDFGGVFSISPHPANDTGILTLNPDYYDIDIVFDVTIHTVADTVGALVSSITLSITVENLIVFSNPPSGLSITSTEINEDASAYARGYYYIGDLAVIDDDGGTHILEIVQSVATDYSDFIIINGGLYLTTRPQHHIKSSYSVDIRVTDSEAESPNNYFEQQFRIDVINGGAISLSYNGQDLNNVEFSHPENTATVAASIYALNEQGIVLHNANLRLEGSDSGFFEILQNIDGSFKLKFKNSYVVNYESVDYPNFNQVYNLDIIAERQVSPGETPTPYSYRTSVRITDVDDFPTDLTLTSDRVAESIAPVLINSQQFYPIGEIGIVDEDQNENFLQSNMLFIIDSPHDNSQAFTLGSDIGYAQANYLFMNTQPDYEIFPTYIVNIGVRNSANAAFYSKGFYINVTNINETPIFRLTYYGSSAIYDSSGSSQNSYSIVLYADTDFTSYVEGSGYLLITEYLRTQVANDLPILMIGGTDSDVFFGSPTQRANDERGYDADIYFNPSARADTALPQDKYTATLRKSSSFSGGATIETNIQVIKPGFTADVDSNGVLQKTTINYADIYGSGTDWELATSNIALANLDSDAALEMVVVSTYLNVDGVTITRMAYYDDTSTTASPNYERVTGTDDPFNAINLNVIRGSLTRWQPVFIDVDNDRDSDLLILNSSRELFYYNSGAGGNYVDETYNIRSRFGSIDFTTVKSMAARDVDTDGDEDLVVLKNDNTLGYFESAYVNFNRLFVEHTGADNPFNGITVANAHSLGFIDADGTGKRSLVIAKTDGTLSYFLNTGSLSSASFQEQTSANNPLSSVNIGTSADMIFTDIDGDYDLDLIGTSGNTESFYIENTWWNEGG